jgi:alpha-D-xyloside xylohydrolase
MDTVEQLDYYFIYGNNLDHIIKGYRLLTGDAPLLPKRSYGYNQSREAEQTQDELIATATEYRKREIPLDWLVQDWNTWETGKWGNTRLDRSRYPDIKSANEQLHNMNVHSMISIWPNMHFDCEDYKEFQNAGLLL